MLAHILPCNIELGILAGLASIPLILTMGRVWLAAKIGGPK